jgi:hypothetical protein
MSHRVIDNTIIKWYDHFLKTRTVTSTLGGTEAAIRPGKGAPQGGVISAIISWNLVFDNFLKIYDNSVIKSIGFADDGTLLITGICIKTIYDIMQKALQHAENWAAENGLKFCPKKTNAILFTRKHIKIESLPHLRMYGQQVPNVKETKILGVVIDFKLNWTPHITQKIVSCKKALMMICPLLRRTWSPKPIYARWLYEGVIIPMLTYGSIRKKLSSLQRLGLTAITFVRQGPPTMGMELIYGLRCHDRKSRAEHKSKKIISLQLHFKYQRTKDQGPRPRLKWREGAVYSITSNTRGPRTKDQTEVERMCSLQTHFKYHRTKDQTEVKRGCSL